MEIALFRFSIFLDVILNRLYFPKKIYFMQTFQFSFLRNLKCPQFLLYNFPFTISYVSLFNYRLSLFFLIQLANDLLFLLKKQIFVFT